MTDKETEVENSGAAAFRRAVEILGGTVKTGWALGVSQSAVSYYILRKRCVPAPWAPKIEAATALVGNRIRKEELRPDVFNAEQSQ